MAATISSKASETDTLLPRRYGPADTLTPVRFGENEGLRYLDGDSYGIRLRIPGDDNSYLLLTVIRAAADPDDFAALPEDPAFAAMLAGIRFTLRR